MYVLSKTYYDRICLACKFANMVFQIFTYYFFIDQHWELISLYSAHSPPCFICTIEFEIGSAGFHSRAIHQMIDLIWVQNTLYFIQFDEISEIRTQTSISCEITSEDIIGSYSSWWKTIKSGGSETDSVTRSLSSVGPSSSATRT